MADGSRPEVPEAQATVCPYCGHISGNPQRCRVCGGRFDPLSRQATQNTMGPWYVRDEAQPFLPGCSYETLSRMVRRGRVTRASIIRGPTTRQFWLAATRVPGVAHLLGECHSCHASVSAEMASCPVCDASFEPEGDRESLGLSPVHLIPGQATPDQIVDGADHAPAPVRRVAPARVGAAPVMAPGEVAAADEEGDGIEPGTSSSKGRSRGWGARIGSAVVVIAVFAGIGLRVLRSIERDRRASEPARVTRPEPAPVEVPAPAAPEAKEVARDVEASEPPAPADAEVARLLREGRIEDALAASESSGNATAQGVIEGRLARDRIRGALGG